MTMAQGMFALRFPERIKWVDYVIIILMKTQEKYNQQLG